MCRVCERERERGVCVCERERKRKNVSGKDKKWWEMIDRERKL